MTLKLLVVLVSMAFAVVFSLACAVIAAFFAREKKKSWPVALGSSVAAMLATLTVLISMIDVIAGAL